MKLQYRSSAPPLLLATAKSFVATLLSVACVFTVGVDLPLPVAAAVPAAVPAKDKKPKQDPVLKGLPITELSADEAILHALNRLAYGPRPGDVERVRQTGLAKWIDQQLNPNSIDDKAVEARLDTYPTLRMSSATLLAQYPQPKQAEKQAAKQAQTVASTRSDAAAAVVARDMQPSRGRTQAAGEAPVPAETQGAPGQPSGADDAANAGAQPQSMQAANAPDGASPMKLDESQTSDRDTRRGRQARSADCGPECRAPRDRRRQQEAATRCGRTPPWLR